MCYDEHKSYQGSFQQGKEHETMKEKRRDSKGRILHTGERANEQTGNTYINMWTHLETQNMCMPGD